jgi:hypothetical protein
VPLLANDCVRTFGKSNCPCADKFAGASFSEATGAGTASIFIDTDDEGVVSAVATADIVLADGGADGGSTVIGTDVVSTSIDTDDGTAVTAADVASEAADAGIFTDIGAGVASAAYGADGVPAVTVADDAGADIVSAAGADVETVGAGADGGSAVIGTDVDTAITAAVVDSAVYGASTFIGAGVSEATGDSTAAGAEVDSVDIGPTAIFTAAGAEIDSNSIGANMSDDLLDVTLSASGAAGSSSDLHAGVVSVGRKLTDEFDVVTIIGEEVSSDGSEAVVVVCKVSFSDEACNDLTALHFGHTKIAAEQSCSS